MEEKYFNRYRSFCRSLRNLKKSKSADPAAEFVLEGTIQNYNLTFDLAWKVMKDNRFCYWVSKRSFTISIYKWIN